jgi:transcriptional regulator with XRE-family HTH domain
MTMSPEDIKRCRTSLKMSQEELADALDVSRKAVMRWEKGHFQISPEYEKALLSLATVMEAPPRQPWQDGPRPKHLVGTMPEEAFNPDVKPVGHPYYAHVPEEALLWVPAFTVPEDLPHAGEQMPGRWCVDLKLMTKEQRLAQDAARK